MKIFSVFLVIVSSLLMASNSHARNFISATDYNPSQGGFKYFSKSDGCKPSDEWTCVSEQRLIEICDQTKDWIPESVMWKLDMGSGVAYEIFSNAGYSSIDNADVYVNKNRDHCVLTFEISGMLKGTSYNQKHYCLLDTITVHPEGYYTVSSNEWNKCFHE